MLNFGGVTIFIYVYITVFPKAKFEIFEHCSDDICLWVYKCKNIKFLINEHLSDWTDASGYDSGATCQEGRYVLHSATGSNAEGLLTVLFDGLGSTTYSLYLSVLDQDTFST